MNKMEHITVVYFSPTGGTRKACLNLAMEMGKKVKDVDLCSLEGEYSFGPEDTVIVGVPVFGGRIPGYAAEKLTYLKGGGAVALTAAVYGNRAFEDALLELDDCLKAQGFRIGAVSYTHLDVYKRQSLTHTRYIFWIRGILVAMCSSVNPRLWNCL